MMTGYKYSWTEKQQHDESFKKTWMEYRIRLRIVSIALLIQPLFFAALILIITSKQSTPLPIGRNLRDSVGNYCMFLIRYEISRE